MSADPKQFLNTDEEDTAEVDEVFAEQVAMEELRRQTLEFVRQTNEEMAAAKGEPAQAG